jgi:hypothetical protein
MWAHDGERGATIAAGPDAEAERALAHPWRESDMGKTAVTSLLRAALATLALLAAAALPAGAADPPRPVTSADKLAAALLESKDCQNSKVEGATQFVKCRYTYKGLRFVHVTFRPKQPPPTTEAVIQVEYLEPSMVSVQLARGKGRCLVIADGPTSVTFGIDSGKFQPVVAGRPGPECDSK